MSELEGIQSKLCALHRRLERLEQLRGLRSRACSDCEAAAALVSAAGLAPECLLDPSRNAERRRIARLLRDQDWSAARISRVMSCCERSIERWLGLAT